MTTAPLDVPLLKNLRFGSSDHLPYRADHLATHGIHTQYTDRPWTRLAARIPPHQLQTVLMARRIARAEVVLAMFESSAHPLAYARSFGGPLARPRLAVLSCWLPEVLADASPARLARYRRAYATVDLLFCFSRNQVATLADLLQLDPDRIRPLAFGVDDEFFGPTTPSEVEAPGRLLAAGRDRGRDWETLFEAVRRADTECDLICRPADIAAYERPAQAHMLGVVDRATYRDHLGASRAVVVATHVLGYPTGQSVLLEAMAMARCCIVTDTPAIREYVDPGRTAIVVPPHDPDALAEAMQAVTTGRTDTDAIGERARATVLERYRASSMWAEVATHLHALAAEGR